MKRTEKISKVVEVEDSYVSCDFCGYEIAEKNNRGCCGFRTIMTCSVCGKSFCKKCGKAIWYDGSGSDYPDTYHCNVCDSVYREYLPKLNELYEEYEMKKDLLINVWTRIAVERSERECLNQ